MPRPSDLATYARAACNEPPLSIEVENALALAAAAGDAIALNRLMTAHLRLVITIAHRYTGRGLELEDLIAEGNLGLVRGAKTYVARDGARFAAYARGWIHGQILKALDNAGHVVDLPAHLMPLLRDWDRAERSLWHELGRAPSEDEVAAALGLTGQRQAMVRMALAARTTTLEADLRGDAGETVSMASTCEAREDETDDLEMLYERRHDVQKRWHRLETDERLMLIYSFGLKDHRKLPIGQIKQIMGISNAQARTLLESAMAKLRRPVKPYPPARCSARRSKKPVRETL